MEDDRGVSSLAATGSVGSRFVTESDLEDAKKRKEEQWKAAYARLGQEPPPRAEEEEEYDPRTLYEKLAAQKEAKREEWDAKMKPSNQFRGLEPDEIQFLGEVARERREEEEARERAVEEELRAFKERQKSQTELGPAAGSSSAGSATTASAPSKPPAPRPTAKNNVKSLLKGVKVVAKPKPASPATTAASASSAASAPLGSKAAGPSGSTSGDGIVSALSPRPSATIGGADKGKTKVDEGMYAPAPAAAQTQTPPAKAAPPAQAAAKAASAPEKRKIQALEADYGSDSEDDDEDAGAQGDAADSKRQKVGGA